MIIVMIIIIIIIIVIVNPNQLQYREGIMAFRLLINPVTLLIAQVDHYGLRIAHSREIYD